MDISKSIYGYLYMDGYLYIEIYIHGYLYIDISISIHGYLYIYGYPRRPSGRLREEGGSLGGVGGSRSHACGVRTFSPLIMMLAVCDGVKARFCFVLTV